MTETEHTPIMAISDSPPTSIGSDLFAVIALLVTSTIVLLILRHFLPLRTTPAFLLVPIGLSLFLPASIVLLVPIDLASSSRTSNVAARGIWLPDGVILVAWRIAYWLTFALTWLLLPLLGEYVDSGYRTPNERALYSLRANARYQLIVLTCGTIGLVYVFLQNGFEGTSVKSLIMALAYCWGLIQAIYLMGHGLVAVPRKLFRHANISGRLRRIQVHAPKVYEKLEDSITELAELEEQLSQLRQKRSGVTRNHQEWIEDMVDLSSLTSADQSLLAAAAAAPPPNVITDRYLADLNRRLIRARHKRQRFADQWQRHVQEAVDTQAIIDATASRKLEMTKLDDKPVQRAWIKLSPSLRYYLHAKILPGIDMFFGGLFSIASCFIVWSEVFKNIAPKLSIIRLTVIRHESSDRGKVGFTGQLIASLWIFYMIASALTSFNDVKIWGNRALTRRNTYGESACWYAGQVAKLTVPLSYNFITFLPKEIYQETTFFKFLGRLIVLTPLGKGFDYFFPIFILVPVCATLFNLYGRVRDVFGFGIPVDDEEGENSNPTGYGTGGWREGRDLIEQEVRGRTNLTGTSTPLSNSNGGRSQQLPNERGNAAIVDPLLRVARSERPARSVSPAVGRNTNTTSSNRPAAPISQRSEISRRQAERLAAATEAAEEEDENAFSGFAHRVRNTLDRVERPEWLPDVGKRPKWMGGGDDATGGGGSQAGGGGSTGIGRWFGRPAEGKVRL